MNRDWAQYWINLFSAQTDELMSLYSPTFHFEDVNFDLEIRDDLPALRAFFENFVNPDRSKGYNDFDVFDYVVPMDVGNQAQCRFPRLSSRGQGHQNAWRDGDGLG